MRAIFGLGNPGAKFKNTRHNLGYIVLDSLIKKFDSISFKKSLKLKAYIAFLGIDNTKVLLAKPTTFMNNSGESVKKIVDIYKIETKNILIVCDDIDLPFGQIRFREKGGSGGHRGLDSIIAFLGTEKFNRLRVGIGRPLDKSMIADYVLSEFDDFQKEKLAELVDRVCSACLDWIKYGSNYVMANYNN